MRLIKRRECAALSKLSGWVLLYGRRKVGKTTLIKNCVRHDVYVLVGQGGGAAVLGGELVPVESALREVGVALRRGGVAVVDEFQRLPARFWDLLASWAPNGVLVASGSSHGVLGKVFDRSSPLLGLFAPFHVDIIAYSDILPQVGDPVLSMLWRDPWLIPHIGSAEELKARARDLALAARGLVGEVFAEEDRELTEIYWRAILLVAAGYWKSSDVAGALGLRGGLASASSILARLAKMGVLRAIPTLGRERYYAVRSPALSLILYAEAKYNVSDLGSTPPELPLGREAQFTVGEMLAEHFGATQRYSPREDVDVVLTRGRRRIWAFEVKMGPFTAGEAKEAASKLRKVAEKTGLVSLAETPPDVADLSLGPRELVEMARDIARRYGVV
ncbi:MAG: ATP-binding protein [Thermoproteus sp.]